MRQLGLITERERRRQNVDKDRDCEHHPPTITVDCQRGEQHGCRDSEPGDERTATGRKTGTCIEARIHCTMFTDRVAMYAMTNPP